MLANTTTSDHRKQRWVKRPRATRGSDPLCGSRGGRHQEHHSVDIPLQQRREGVTKGQRSTHCKRVDDFLSHYANMQTLETLAPQTLTAMLLRGRPLSPTGSHRDSLRQHCWSTGLRRKYCAMICQHSAGPGHEQNACYNRIRR